MSDQDLLNQRAVPGDNSAIDFAGMMLADLDRDYKGPKEDSAKLLAEAAALVETIPVPRIIRDEAIAEKLATLYRRIKDHAKNLTAFHAREKLPHKVRGETCDSFFFGQIDKLARRDKKNKAGAADVLFAIYDEFNQFKLREEELARERELERLAQIERDRVAAAQEAERVAEEARLAAERARAPAQIEKKQEIAQEAAVEADSKKVDAILATDAADKAELATKASPAQMVRTRYESGIIGTMQTENFAEVTDRATLDLEKLRPHLSIAVLEAALRLYAAGFAYSNAPENQITGAKFGKRPKSRIK